MTKKSKPRRKTIRPFRVGDKVYIQLFGNKRTARIIEDRGRIGIGGRQLLRVVYLGTKEFVEEPFEIPAVEVTHARPPRATKANAART
jgi:hypothetical protein